jgi:hypothetical protein
MTWLPGKFQLVPVPSTERLPLCTGKFLFVLSVIRYFFWSLYCLSFSTSFGHCIVCHSVFLLVIVLSVIRYFFWPLYCLSFGISFGYCIVDASDILARNDMTWLPGKFQLVPVPSTERLPLCTGKFLFSSNSRIMPYFGQNTQL